MLHMHAHTLVQACDFSTPNDGLKKEEKLRSGNFDPPIWLLIFFKPSIPPWPEIQHHHLSHTALVLCTVLCTRSYH